MKPEFLRPFDAAAACRGAPFCCTNGWRAEVLKYAVNGLFGTITKPSGEEYAASWTVAGEPDSGVISPDKGLAMLPLGRIEDKPVFVGDRLLDDKGKEFTVVPGQVFGPGCLCKWAPPAKVYPQTKMRHDDMFSIYSAELRGRGHTSVEAETHGLEAISNAALRHAIDAGQVVDAEESAEAIRKAYADGQAIAFKHEAGGRAARDMAVANAVRDELVASVARYSTGCSQYISSGFDFEAIIATIK